MKRVRQGILREKNKKNSARLLRADPRLTPRVTFKLTLSEGEKADGRVGEYPRVSAELEQIVGENVGQPDAEPAFERKPKM